jgi:hypothetical protein
MCAELVEKGGYTGIDPADVARGLNAISDGLWADLLVLPETFDLDTAKRICRTFLAAVFPRHFTLTGQIKPAANDPGSGGPPTTSVAGDLRAVDHRRRLAAALRRRVFPETALQPTELAARLDIGIATILDWLDGRSEPSSSQLGRLIAIFDPTFIMELYGSEVDTMQQRFEACLAEARETELRARAALDILRGRG